MRAAPHSGAVLERARPRIAFFDYPDVFEDFYPHFGVSQHDFATTWDATGSHAFMRLIQRDIGEVVWCSFALAPQLVEARHRTVGCRVTLLRSSIAHRVLWRAYYAQRWSWRLRRAYPAYAFVASYLSPATTRLLAFLRRERPDLLLVQDYASGKFDLLIGLAGCFGLPLVALHTGSEPHDYLGKAAKRISLPRATRLVASSRRELERLAESYGVDRSRLLLILTPIDTEMFQPTSREEACFDAGLDPRKRYLLFMGRLDDPVKRVSMLLRSFGAATRERTGLELLVAGDGPDRQALVELASRVAPGRCRFLGWVSCAHRRRALYNSADYLALVSKREGFPTVVGEAMACGTPVLATDVGGVSELVDEGITGWLCRPGDEATLTALLATRLGTVGPFSTMRDACRRAAQARVSERAVAQALAACLGAALKERRPSR